jgi:hypothetical protein
MELISGVDVEYFQIDVEQISVPQRIAQNDAK